MLLLLVPGSRSVFAQRSARSDPALLSIAVTPADAEIFPDRMEQFTARGMYSDGRTHDLTRRVTWSSSAPDVATIDREGRSRAVGEGQTTIEAAIGTINGTTTLNVASFVLTGSMTTDVCCRSATLLNNGMVLMAGGWNYSGGALASAELYNPATGTFTPTGSLNIPRQQHTATLLDNGMVLIAGGLSPYTSSGTLASAELYNPATGTFTPTGSLNTERWGHTATLLSNGMVLITGTWGSGGTAELYNPATGTFSYTAGSMNIAPVDQTATLLNNGMVLIAGGDGPLTASAELFNPVTETFTPTGSLNTARAAHTATLLNNGTVLIAGGYGEGDGVIASAELYDPMTGIFTPTGSLNTVRVLDTATLLNNGMVLIAGGSLCDGPCGGALPGAELYDPATGTFTPTSSMNVARFWDTGTLLNNGLVLMAGGEDSSAYYISSAELYEPATRTPPDLESINITPERHILSPGETEHFIAMGRFRDGSTEQLASVTWSSWDPRVAQITNDSSNHGAAMAIARGEVIIEAWAGRVRGWARLTVR